MTLTQKLKALEFMCVEEVELYVLGLNESTALFVEGTMNQKGEYVYMFYKQTFGRFSKVEFYGRALREKQLIGRIEKYFGNRQKHMMKQLQRKGRGFQVKSRKELLGELLGKNT